MTTGLPPLILAANRAPFDVDYHGRPMLASGGLAAALAGLERRRGIHWVACARTRIERALAEGARPDRDPDDSPSLVSYAPVEPQAYEPHYSMVANPVLWLIHHGLTEMLRGEHVGPGFDRAWRSGYRAVNETVARHLARMCVRLPDAHVLIQDYHLHLTGGLLRERVPEAVVHHFLHVPWSEPSAWSVLPAGMVCQILHGLLGVDALGLQTRNDVERFLLSCEMYLGARVDWSSGSVRYGRREVHVSAHPVPLDLLSLRSQNDAPEVAAEALRLSAMRPELLVLRVDRADPTKNIVAGFGAFARMLQEHPELHGRVQFWALLEPSRMEIPLYRDHLLDAQVAAEAVNRRFERPGWRPIWLSLDHGRPTVLAALQQFDCLLVNARRDGMNLVAKEGALINRRNGTIALSTAAGAHHELQGAVVSIEPTDELDTARALHRCLVMPPAERERRALLAADRVGSRSIDTWLSELIGDLEFRERA